MSRFKKKKTTSKNKNMYLDKKESFNFHQYVITY